MADELVHAERRDGVLILTLDDPTSRNALSHEMANHLYHELDAFEANPNDRVLVLTGQDPSFCSGANVRRFSQVISERTETDEPGRLPWGDMEQRLASHDIDKGEAGFGSVSDVPIRISDVQKPTIAAINGHAIGVGLGIALSCDIRIASDRAELAEAFVRMGLVPGDGSCWQLPRLIGLSNTLYMQYTGERIPADAALAMGLVTKVYEHRDLMPQTLDFAARLAQGATYAMSLTKYLVKRSQEMDLRESLRLAQAAQERARSSADHAEAVSAFLEKRSPRLVGY